jgi:hypothetical protein
MDDREWLGSRHPSPPAKLFDRLELALDPLREALTISRSEILSSAAAAILAPLIASEGTEPTRNRKTAIDLLAADALVTYAIEAATEDCQAIAQNIDRVVQRLASLAPAGSA